MTDGRNPADGGAAGDDPEPEPDGEDVIGALFQDSRTNAVLAWLLVVVLVAVLVESVADADWLWTIFVAVTGAIVLLPPLAYRDWRMMLPWELLVIALAPILVRAAVGGELGTFAYYLSVAALALVVTVELDEFTVLDVTHWFAVVLVVMTTMASAAAWAVVRWLADRYLGAGFLVDPEPDRHLGGVLPAYDSAQEAANAALMVEFVWVTLAGLVAGVVFDAYFRRRDRQLRRRLREVTGL